MRSGGVGCQCVGGDSGGGGECVWWVIGVTDGVDGKGRILSHNNSNNKTTTTATNAKQSRARGEEGADWGRWTRVLCSPRPSRTNDKGREGAGAEVGLPEQVHLVVADAVKPPVSGLGVLEGQHARHHGEQQHPGAPLPGTRGGQDTEGHVHAERGILHAEVGRVGWGAGGERKKEPRWPCATTPGTHHVCLEAVVHFVAQDLWGLLSGTDTQGSALSATRPSACGTTRDPRRAGSTTANGELFAVSVPGTRWCHSGCAAAGRPQTAWRTAQSPLP